VSYMELRKGHEEFRRKEASGRSSCGGLRHKVSERCNSAVIILRDICRGTVYDIAVEKCLDSGENELKYII